MKGSISYKSRIANRSREGSRETVALCDKFWLADPRGTHGSSSSPNKGPLILIVAWYHLLSSWWYGVCLWAMNGLDHAVSWNWRLEPPRNGLLREGGKTFRVSLEIPWILSLRNIEETSDYDLFNRFFWGAVKTMGSSKCSFRAKKTSEKLRWFTRFCAAGLDQSWLQKRDYGW